jgi:hypothetical protein
VLNMGLAADLGIIFHPTSTKRAKLLWSHSGKTIVHIDSYHAGYRWSDGIRKGIQKALKNTGINLLTHQMDTKRRADESFKVSAAAKARAFIETTQPDLVIACDDNASKYLVSKYYKNVELPFVFCGVNWDELAYGYPYQNATGIVEVDFINLLVAQLKRHSKGDRIGVISDFLILYWQAFTLENTFEPA